MQIINIRKGIVFLISPAIVFSLMVARSSQAELYFPPSLISDGDGDVADLSRFNQSEAQLPGHYQVDIWVNGENKGTETITFVPLDSQSDDANVVHDSTGLSPCLTAEMLLSFGMKAAVLESQASKPRETCLLPGQLVAEAYTSFDFQTMRLEISIPQIAMTKLPKGWVPQTLWDEGITAALLNYNFNGNSSHSDYGTNRNLYLNLTTGFNWGAWRFRDVSSRAWYQTPSANYQKQQHLQSYIERGIIPWRSQLVLGDSVTAGDVFDPIGFKGAKLASDENMYPGTERGFAPVIRGNATSNAHVSVHQNGYLVYQTNVAPGAFAINDLYPMYAGGDLNVRVTEADGSVQVFTVPYASTPTLLREGRIKYETSVGRFRSSSDQYDSPAFAQGTLIWGLADRLTVYGGGQFSDNYRAFALGSGINMGRLGALSADITQANSTLADGSHHQGQSLRFLWLHSLNSLGTNFQITGYRYSTQGFHTLDETALKTMNGWLYPDTFDEMGRKIDRPASDYYNLNNNQREKFQVSVSQRISTGGSLYINGVRETFWNRSDASESLQAGYSGSLGALNYNLSYSHNRYAGFSGRDQSFYLSFNLPLNALLPGMNKPVYATFNASRDGKGNQSWQSGLSGSLLQENNLSWQVSQGQNSGKGYGGNMSLNYQGAYGNSNVGYSYDTQTSQLSLGLSGGVLAHSEGVTFSQPLGDTNVLIAAPGASGVSLGSGMATDWRGYTVKPYLSPYQENRVALDITEVSDLLEIDNAVQRVVPTEGAIVKATFKTLTGARVLMTLTKDGKALPFGTTVTTENGGMGIVGDEGQVYLSGLQKEGVLEAQWGNQLHCTAKYQLPARDSAVQVMEMQQTCD